MQRSSLVRTILRAHPPLIAAPAEACAAANPWSGVVRGAKVVVKRGAGVLWRRLPVARRLGLNVPVGAKRGAYGLLWLLLNFSLGPFLGGVLSVCESFHSESARYHFFPKNDPLSLFGFCQHDVAAASGELQAPHLKEWPSHSSPSERAQ